MTIAKNLIADERVRFESKKHWVAPIRASGIAITAEEFEARKAELLARI